MSYYGNNNNNNSSHNDRYRRSSRDRSRSRERPSSYYGGRSRNNNGGNHDDHHRHSHYNDSGNNNNRDRDSYYGNGDRSRESHQNFRGDNSYHRNVNSTDDRGSYNNNNYNNDGGYQNFRGRDRDRYDQDRGHNNNNNIRGGGGGGNNYNNDGRYYDNHNNHHRDSSSSYGRREENNHRESYGRRDEPNSYYGRRNNDSSGGNNNSSNYYGPPSGGGRNSRDEGPPPYSNFEPPPSNHRDGGENRQRHDSSRNNNGNNNNNNFRPPPHDNHYQPRPPRHAQEEQQLAWKAPPNVQHERNNPPPAADHRRGQPQPPPPHRSQFKTNEPQDSSYNNYNNNTPTLGAMSNCIVADLTTNFHFFIYGIDCSDPQKKLIESRRIRQEMFFKGLEKFCKDREMTQKESADLNRSLFFEGSFFFGARALPGIINPKNYVFYNDPNVGQFTITKMTTYGRPECLSFDDVDIPAEQLTKEQNNNNNNTEQTESSANESGTRIPKKQRAEEKTESSRSMLLADYRCNNCCSAFTSSKAILVHCQTTGHKPIYADDLKNVETPKKDVFLTYCNVALQRALSERMVRWGCEYIDPRTFTEPRDKQNRSLGLKMFRAFSCDFNCMNTDTGSNLDPVGSKKIQPLSLILTVDLRAKIIRTQNLLNLWCDNTNPNQKHFDEHTRRQIRNKWINEQIICIYDKKTYGIVDILFDESPASMIIPTLNMSHAEYFQKKKGIELKFPNAKPMIKTFGRNKSPIYLPAELVCGNELDSKARSILPLVASFAPKERNDAINEMKRYLQPGGQKTKGSGGGFLPALGIILREERLKVKMRHLSLPSIIAAGLSHTIPTHKKNNWLSCLRDAQFSVNPNECITLNVIVVYNHRLGRSYMEVYTKIARLVNNFRSKYRFPETPFAAIEAGDIQYHWESVEQYFKFNQHRLPPNIFVLDFTKPPNRATVDQAYKVVKQMLGRAGYLSQFVNFNSADHTDSRQIRKSNSILNGVSRQILNKCGLRIWWIDLPKTIPLPAIFVGADVFHSARKFDSGTGKMAGKASCAAAVIQLVRQVDGPKGKMSTIELYSTTRRRDAGREIGLGSFLRDAIGEALRHFNVNPLSCIVWRDGVGVGSLNNVFQDEVQLVRHALENMSLGNVQSAPRPVDLAYVICQKEISTKFISCDGNRGMQPGALIEGMKLTDHETFYINGSSPPFSTPRAVRFVVLQKDEGLQAVRVPDLAWALCHDYPNWTGPIKVPSLVQMAHKLAELAGNYDDCGDSMNNSRFANTMHFL